MRRCIKITGASLLFGGMGTALAGNNGALVWREVGQIVAPSAPRFTIRAGPVEHNEARAMSGTFQVTRTGAPDGIPSSFLAGACLEFLAADLGFAGMAAIRCEKNSDCAVPSENEFGACDTATNRCWSKPPGIAAGLKLCNRGVIAAPSDRIPVPLVPVNVEELGIKRGSHVRVGACLNKAGIDPRATGCLALDGKDKIQVWGPISSVR